MWDERFAYHKLFHSFMCKYSAPEADEAHANGLILRSVCFILNNALTKMV